MRYAPDLKTRRLRVSEPTEQDRADAAVIAAALAIVERRMRRGPAIESPTNLREYLYLRFADAECERFDVVFLDGQHRVLAAETLFTGSLTQTSVYPREVVRRALTLNAGAVILAHNHPSGAAEPSRADEFLTQSLKSALALVDVRVLDHIVVAGATSTSFAERGLL